MKKLKPAIISILIALTLLTGCTQVVGEVPDEALVFDENTDPEEYAVNMFNKVLGLIEEKDSEAIFDLFSKYDRDNYDLMPEIENVVEYFDSEVSKIELLRTLNELTMWDGYSASAYITTKNKTEYLFEIRVTTASEEEYKLGLDEIYIQNLTLLDEYWDEYRDWTERRKNGSDEQPPEGSPDSIATVNYVRMPKDRPKDRDKE